MNIKKETSTPLRQDVYKRQARDSAGMISFYQIMKDTLDYRRWFEFQLFSQKNGERQKELTNSVFGTFSGGEKAMSMYVPLFLSLIHICRAATEIKNVVDVKYNEQQPLIAFVYDNDEMSVPTLDDFINSQIDFLSKNDYVYYVAFEFCK